MSEKHEVIVKSLWQTNSATSLGSANDPHSSLLYKGEILNVIKRQTLSGGTIRVQMTNGKWTTTKMANGTNMTKMLSSTTKPVVTQEPPFAYTIPSNNEELLSRRSSGFDSYYGELMNVRSTRGNPLNKTTRVFGAPYQFLPTTDPRPQIGKNKLGRTYATNIISQAPIVYLQPGKPFYLPDTTEDTKNTIESLFGAKVSGTSKGVIEEILDSLEGVDVDYFEFSDDYNNYIKYVNLLCRSSAIMLGIENETAQGSSTPLKNYDWRNYRSVNTADKRNSSSFLGSDQKPLASSVKNIIQSTLSTRERTVEFYADPSSTYGISASNSTTESMFAQLFDKGSAMAREAAFIGETLGVDLVEKAATFTTDALSEIGNVGKKGGIVDRLMSTSSHVLLGSNVSFPEIWDDSSYGESFPVSVTLRTPYGSKLSYYFDILVPILHLIALMFPRQTSGNTYTSPFLVRANAPGWFSCSMGIIDSLSIDKGGEGKWSVDGLPIEARVSMNIKSLRSAMSITGGRPAGKLFSNSELVEFLAVNCGLDLTQNALTLKVNLIFEDLFNMFADTPANLMGEVKGSIYNWFQKSGLGGLR